MPEEQSTKMSLLLVQSDDIVSCMQGQVPVILVSTKDPHGHVVKAVNFLRSGCPEVQIVFNYNIEGTWRTEWRDKATEILSDLASDAGLDESFAIYTDHANIDDALCLRVVRHVHT